jgi:hypothetical protein
MLASSRRRRELTFDAVAAATWNVKLSPATAKIVACDVLVVGDLGGFLVGVVGAVHLRLRQRGEVCELADAITLRDNVADGCCRTWRNALLPPPALLQLVTLCSKPKTTVTTTDSDQQITTHVL